MRLNLGSRVNVDVFQRAALRNSLWLVTFLVGSIPRFLRMDIWSHPRVVIDDSLRGRTPKLNLGCRYPPDGEFTRSMWQDAGGPNQLYLHQDVRHDLWFVVQSRGFS